MADVEALQLELEQTVTEAFDRFGCMALWSYRRPDAVTPDTGRWVARSLRLDGSARAAPLIVRLEELSDAVDRSAASHHGDDRDAA